MRNAEEEAEEVGLAIARTGVACVVDAAKRQEKTKEIKFIFK
jgi:hypothetical protein